MPVEKLDVAVQVFVKIAPPDEGPTDGAYGVDAQS